MLKKSTVIDQIELCRDGITRLRIALLVLDGEKEIFCKWHRTMLEADIDPEAQMNIVNEHLASMGEEVISPAEVAKIKRAREFHKQEHGK